MDSMKSHSSRTWLFYLLGIVAVGMVAWWVVKAVIAAMSTLLVLALIVGGIYLYTKARRSLSGGGRGQLR
jgi:hypothetical protein